MAEEDLDALVVRAPDNVLYLTNFWGMKGYDAVVFPREGDPTLICLEASAGDADRMAWTTRRPLVPRLRRVRPAAAAGEGAGRSQSRRPRTTGRSASSSRSGRRRRTAWSASRRRTPEPGSTPGRAPADATPLLARARAIKTEQELERMRLANEIAAAAMDYTQRQLRPGMKESEAAALWNGYVHGRGTGWEGKVDLALRLLPRLVGRRDPDVHGDRRPAGAGERADAVRDLGLRRRLLVRPHEEPLPGRAHPEYERLRESLLAVYERAIDHCRPGASLAELDRLIREGIDRGGVPGPAVTPGCARRRRPGPRAAVRAPGRHERHGRGGHGARDRARRLLGRGRRSCAWRTTS